MGWSTTLTNGRGLFGTPEFLFSTAYNMSVLARAYEHDAPVYIGPEFDRSRAEICHIRPNFDGYEQFSEMNVEFIEGQRIGNRSFYLHNNVLQLLAASKGVQVASDLISEPVTVFHLNNWDVGFSPQLDLRRRADSLMVLASGGMYVGLPIFFRDIAIKGGIIEGAESVWRFASSDFPYKKFEGNIGKIEEDDSDEVIVNVRASQGEGSFAIPATIAQILRTMFDVEHNHDLSGCGVVLFAASDNGSVVALRPL